MSKLGFGYGPAGKSSGSGRTFSAPKSLGGGSMRMDEVSSYFVDFVMYADIATASW